MGKIDKEIEATLEALKRRGFDARYAENREVARKMIVEIIFHLFQKCEIMVYVSTNNY